MCRLSPRTVQRQIAALAAAGEVEIEGRSGRSGTNSYCLPGVINGGPIGLKSIRHSPDVRQVDAYDSGGSSIRQPRSVDTSAEAARYDTAVSPDPKTPVDPRTPWGAAAADARPEPAQLEGQTEAFEIVPASEPAPWAAVAKNVYDATDGALPFMGMQTIAKWAITHKGVTGQAVEAAIGALWRAGRAVTKQTVAQHLEGHLQPHSPGLSLRQQEIADYERRKGLTAPAPRGESSQ